MRMAQRCHIHYVRHLSSDCRKKYDGKLEKKFKCRPLCCPNRTTDSYKCNHSTESYNCDLRPVSLIFSSDIRSYYKYFLCDIWLMSNYLAFRRLVIRSITCTFNFSRTGKINTYIRDFGTQHCRTLTCTSRALTSSCSHSLLMRCVTHSSTSWNHTANGRTEETKLVFQLSFQAVVSVKCTQQLCPSKLSPLSIALVVNESSLLCTTSRPIFFDALEQRSEEDAHYDGLRTAMKFQSFLKQFCDQ